MGISLATVNLLLGGEARFTVRPFLDRPGMVPELAVDAPEVRVSLRPSLLTHVTDQDVRNADGLLVAAAEFLEQIKRLHTGGGQGGSGPAAA